MGVVEAVLTPASGTVLWQQLLLTAVYCGVLVLRRDWPVPVLAVVVVIGPLIVEVNPAGGVISYVFAAMVAAYTVGRWVDGLATWWGLGLTVGLNWMLFAVTAGELSDYVFVAILYGGAWLVGALLRRRESRITSLVREAQDLREHLVEESARAAAQERVRIARELHDIVSHSISVISIQTQAVRRRLGPGNQREIDDLRTVESAAREAMAEMRRLLGVLRADSPEAAELSPQPGLAQLDRLVRDTGAAGTEVELRIEGDATGLPAGVDLAVYRIVQEALTNVRRHSGAASARVTVRIAADDVEIQVDDDGPSPKDGGAGDDRPPTAASGDTHTAGHGLAGMRERVALYGGQLDAGRRDDGGYRVHVRLPLRRAEV